MACRSLCRRCAALVVVRYTGVVLCRRPRRGLLGFATVHVVVVFPPPSFGVGIVADFRAPTPPGFHKPTPHPMRGRDSRARVSAACSCGEGLGVRVLIVELGWSSSLAFVPSSLLAFARSLSLVVAGALVVIIPGAFASSSLLSFAFSSSSSLPVVVGSKVADWVFSGR